MPCECRKGRIKLVSRKRIKKGLVILFLIGIIYFTHFSLQSATATEVKRKSAKKTTDYKNVRIVARLPPPNMAELASRWHNDNIRKPKQRWKENIKSKEESPNDAGDGFEEEDLKKEELAKVSGETISDAGPKIKNTWSHLSDSHRDQERLLGEDDEEGEEEEEEERELNKEELAYVYGDAISEAGTKLKKAESHHLDSERNREILLNADEDEQEDEDLAAPAGDPGIVEKDKERGGLQKMKTKTKTKKETKEDRSEDNIEKLPPLKNNKEWNDEGDRKEFRKSSVSSFKSLDGGTLYLLQTSGYWDKDKRIRIFGLINRGNTYSPRLRCKFYKSNSSADQRATLATDGHVVKIDDTPKKTKYTACYVLCNTSSSDIIKMNPKIVDISLIMNNNNNNKNKKMTMVTPDSLTVRVPIQIEDKASPGPLKSQFTLCVGPFSSRPLNVSRVVEMVELNRVLGATKFDFYDVDIGGAMRKVMKYYQSKHPGLLNLIDWNLPSNTGPNSDKKKNNDSITSQIDVNRYAKVAAMNDCLYRNRVRSQYVLFVDADEYLIPSNTSFHTWKDLISDRKKQHPRAIAFSFVCSSFPLQWAAKDDRRVTFIEHEPSLVFSHVYRDDFLLGEETGCKHMLEPISVEVIGTKLEYDTVLLRDFVPGSQATVHRYKTLKRSVKEEWTVKGPPLPPPKKVFDNVVLKNYQATVGRSIQKIWLNIRKS